MKNKSDDPWNRDAWIERLAWSRKSMWLTDTLDRLAVWMRLRTPSHSFWELLSSGAIFPAMKMGRRVGQRMEMFS